MHHAEMSLQRRHGGQGVRLQRHHIQEHRRGALPQEVQSR